MPSTGRLRRVTGGMDGLAPCWAMEAMELLLKILLLEKSLKPPATGRSRPVTDLFYNMQINLYWLHFLKRSEFVVEPWIFEGAKFSLAISGYRPERLIKQINRAARVKLCRQSRPIKATQRLTLIRVISQR
jgi:hypothetical protein